MSLSTSKFSNYLEKLRKHIGHKVTYMDDGLKEGTIARLTLIEGIGVKLWLKEKDGLFPKSIYDSQIWECECQTKKERL